MCLGIPGEVIELVAGTNDQLALVDVVGGRQRVNVGMLEPASVHPGDWVLIHMGFAVETLDGEGVARAMAGLELMSEPPPA